MIKKIIIIFVVLFTLLIGAVVAIPFIFKDEINAKIKEQINKELKADVDYTSYDLSILKSFPDLYFILDDLSIVGRGAFEGDTIANIKQIGFGLDIVKLLKQEGLLVKSVHLEKPQIVAYSMITSAGDTIANYDILPTSSPDTSSANDTAELIAININNFTINEGAFFYKDFVSQIEVMVKNLNLDAQADYISDIADVNTTFSIDELSFTSGETQYLNKTKLEAGIALTADLVNSIYTLKDNEITLNALKLYADGTVSMPDENTTSVDLTFSADKSSFKELLSLIPSKYLKDYSSIDARGDFELQGSAKGKITETETPAFDVNLSINNGRIQYPDLPSAIDNINLKASVVNKTSNFDNTNIAIPNATFTIVEQPILMSLNAQHILADPFVDLKVKGSLPLDKVPEFYPLEGVTEIAGNIDADIAFKGLLSQVEKEQNEDVDFAGNLAIQSLVYNAVDMPMPIKVKAVNLDFTPQYANFIADQAVIGKSDFNITGKLENIINYVLADGEIIGNVNINSSSINLDELLTSDEDKSTETTGTENESTSTKVPENMNLMANLDAEEVYYDGIEMKNVKGAVTLADEKVDLTDLSARLMGGSAKISGSYDTKDTDKPKMTFAFDIKDFDIQQTFEQFNTAEAIMPLGKYMKGKFSTDLAVNSFLNNDLSLDLSALDGLGKFTIPYATFLNLPMLDRISDVTKVPLLKNPELKNAWTILKIEDGSVNVEPFDIVMQDVLMNIEGKNGLDQTIDYAIKLTVPSDKFGGAASIANDFLSKQNIPLLNLSVPKNLTFHLGVSGMITSPKVAIKKVTTEQGDQALQDQIKESIKNELDKAKEEAKNQVKEEVDNIKDKAKDELNNTKEEVEENIRKEVEDTKENIKNNIKDKFKGWGK